jgi:hypothetical protein
MTKSEFFSRYNQALVQCGRSSAILHWDCAPEFGDVEHVTLSSHERLFELGGMLHQQRDAYVTGWAGA